jgi:ADP-heptose:LPS heptosyltransferase
MTEGQSKLVPGGERSVLSGALSRLRTFGAEGEGKVARVRGILFVELLGGLGDVLISLQAIQALARSHLEARLTVLTFRPGGERFLRILLDDGLIEPEAISPPRLHLATGERSVVVERLAGTRRPLAFLLPDAGMEVKRWPEESWGKLGRALRDRHDADVVVPVGSYPGQASRVARLVGERTRVWPRGTLRELAAALAHADLVVAADTGPARIAATLGVPTVMLFGPAWHGRYGQAPPHVNLQGHYVCPQRVILDFTQQPCWYMGTCTLEATPWRTCLEDISVEDALAAATFQEGWADPEPSAYEARLGGGV